MEVVENGRLLKREMTWGFLPKWATAMIINAQQETIPSKPTFKNAFLSHRCLVRADGFYEWKKVGWQKIPMRFVLRDGEPFYFAGIWDHFKKAPRPEPTDICDCSGTYLVSGSHSCDASGNLTVVSSVMRSGSPRMSRQY